MRSTVENESAGSLIITEIMSKSGLGLSAVKEIADIH